MAWYVVVAAISGRGVRKATGSGRSDRQISVSFREPRADIAATTTCTAIYRVRVTFGFSQGRQTSGIGLIFRVSHEVRPRRHFFGFGRHIARYSGYKPETS